MKSDGEFVDISAEQIHDVLERHVRQYLAGNLSRPQELPFVRDNRLEIGITRYAERNTEAPHWHSLQREYQYVLSGTTRYHEVIGGAEHVYRAGDFYAILPEICYTQDSIPGTSILFVKHPAIDDKVTCRHCNRENCPGRTESFVAPKVPTP
jgi:quercetin dioxygenase-like cupin family protein